jgi:hypothetical protein
LSAGRECEVRSRWVSSVMFKSFLTTKGTKKHEG